MKFKKAININIIILFIFSGCQSYALDKTPARSETTTPSTEPIMTVSSSQIINSPPWIHYAWFYKPPESELLSLLPDKFDVFILTHKDEEVRDRLQKAGVENPFLQYLLLGELMGTESCDEKPYGNQVAYRPGDFCDISQNHPDWFLLDSSGNRIKYNDFMYYMDPGNKEYRDFWLKQARHMQVEFGWDGIFVDNAEASLSKLHGMGVWLQHYKSDEEYQAAVRGFLSYIHSNFFKPAGRPVVANIIAVKDNQVWLNYLNEIEGAMIEDFAVGYQDDPPTLEEWENQMNAAEQALNMGKSLILVSQGNKNDLARQTFSFASYLLINNGNAAFRYASAEDYGQIWGYDNYAIKLGLPLGNRYKNNGVWFRDFENGTVTVNPKSFEAQIVIK